MSEITDSELLQSLKKYFNFNDFKSDIQKNAVKSILSGKKDIYVSMSTGSGKSICYQLPGVILENKVTIVISPLIALIKNQIDYLHLRKIKAETINSTIGSKERDRILGDLKAKKTDTKFLYITPEQSQTHTFQELFKLMVRFNKIGFIAVDEAHCVSAWGHDFRADYLKLGKWRKEYPSIQWIALTATAPLIVRDDVIKNLSFIEPKIYQASCFRKNLYYDIIYKNSMKDDFIELKDYIAKCLLKEEDLDLKPHNKPCGIIYCRKKETTESVAKGLQRQGVSCKAFHSSLKKSEKEEVQNEWMNGKTKVIAATISFGMGIDKASVRFVIHWDISQSVAAYYQESGRAGRDGKKSYCRLYYDRDEVRTINFILNQDKNRINDIKSDKYLRAQNSIKEFEKIVAHSESIACRHILFTKHFGDPTPKCDAMCDACENNKLCQKKLEIFHQLSSNTLGTSGVDDEDRSELYEGGRPQNLKKGAFDEYDVDDDDEGSSYDHQKSTKERKDERLFIEKQFALRKMQAAASMQMQQSTSMSRIKSAQATEKKVFGLNISKRDENLTKIVETLKKHMEKCKINDPPEYPNANLIYKDLEDIGVDIEYRCFDASKGISIYTRNVVKELKAIMTAQNLLPALKNYLPKQHKSHGGDYKTIVSDLKSRYGNDVVNELEKEASDAKDHGRKARKAHHSNNDSKNQPKINSFFEKKEDKSSNSSGTDELIIDESYTSSNNYNEEEFKENGNDYKNQLLEEKLVDVPIKKEVECIDIKAVPKASILNLLDEKNGSAENKDLEHQKSFKRKAESNAEEIASKHRRKDEENSSKHHKRDEEMTKLSSFSTASDDLKKIRLKNKNKISQMVVSVLNTFYRDQKIGGTDPKSLFKTLARKITHNFYEKSPDDVPSSKVVKQYINEVFNNDRVIKSENDF